MLRERKRERERERAVKKNEELFSTERIYYEYSSPKHENLGF